MDVPSRFTTNLTDGPHPLDAELPGIEGEDAGIPGGLTDAMREAEEIRIANMPEVGPVDGMPTVPNAGGPHVHAPADLTDDVDPDRLHPMEPPRHNRFAQENMEGPGPSRVIPGGPTNAHPDFAVDQFGNPEPNDSVLTTAADLSTTGVPPAAESEETELTEEEKEKAAKVERAAEREAKVEAATAADKAKEAAVIDEAAAPPDSDQAGVPVDNLTPTGAAAAAAEATIAAARPEHEKKKDAQEKEQAAAEELPVLGDALEETQEWEPREEATEAPPQSASKAEWVAYVVANYEITTEAAEALTKADLIETYGT